MYPSRWGKLLVVFPILLLAAQGDAWAATPPDGDVPLTLRSAAEEALRANPDLRAAYEAIEAARGRLVQAGLWPNPELGLSARSDFAFDDEGESSLEAGVAQRFPIAGRIGRAKDVARVDVALALAEAREFERALIGEAQRTAAALLALDRTLAARDRVIEAARELSRVSSKRFERAEVSEGDLNLLRIDLGRFEQERRLLDLERRTAAIRLNRLLYRPPDAPARVTGDIETPLLGALPPDGLVDEALRRRPDLQSLRLESDRAQAEARLARAESWEDWTLGASIDSERAVFRDEPVSDPIGTMRDDFVGVALTIPLPLWNRNQGRIAEASAVERRAALRLRGLERAIEAEIETARQRVAELEGVAREYRDVLLPRAERNVALLQRAYQEGLASIASLVQAEQQLGDVALQHTRTLGELRGAEIDLETAAAASPLLDASSAEGQAP